jgi:hypothetical protein
MADYYWQLFPSAFRISILNVLYCRVKIKDSQIEEGDGTPGLAWAGLGHTQSKGACDKAVSNSGPSILGVLPHCGLSPIIKPQYTYVDPQAQERLDEGFKV